MPKPRSVGNAPLNRGTFFPEDKISVFSTYKDLGEVVFQQSFAGVLNKPRFPTEWLFPVGPEKFHAHGKSK